LVSWLLSFVIGFGTVGMLGLGYFFGEKEHRKKLKDKEIYVALLESALGQQKEICDMKDVRIGQLEKELEDLRTAQSECVEGDKKVAASDIFRTSKGLLSFKKYVRE